MRRRDLIIGGSFVAAAACAYALEPRNRLVLKGGQKIADMIPLKFDQWSAEKSEGLVQPAEEGTLEATLYSEIVGRVYHSSSTDASVMLLAAYGDTQSDMLQLHRPESCYPAVGFKLLSSKPWSLAVTRGNVVLPARLVIAEAPNRRETIIYWARIGESLPTNASEQREARLTSAFRGIVPDGILVRFSVLGDDTRESVRTLVGFIPRLLQAIDPKDRPALLGTHLAKAMDGAQA